MSDKKTEIEITEEGNLGILAYGDIAVEAWRRKRGPIKEEEEKEVDKKKKEVNE